MFDCKKYLISEMYDCENVALWEYFIVLSKEVHTKKQAIVRQDFVMYKYVFTYFAALLLKIN